MKGLEPFIFRVDSTWHTPASDYPLKQIGTAEITRRTMRRNYYRMEAVGGYLFYQATEPYKATALTINGQVVMTDDPINWVGMKKLAEHSKGRVLCGGLGLGLIVHALAKNDEVSEVKVAEINKDVIELVQPLLPTSKTISVDLCDVYLLKNPESYDTIILDMWVGKGNEKVAIQMFSAFAYFKVMNSKNQVFIWGHGSNNINPAVDDNVRAKMPKEYWIT